MSKRALLLCSLLGVAGVLGVAGARAQDPRCYVFLCLGQSNMEGFPGIPAEDKTYAEPRFQVLAAVDFPALGREKGKWYPAVPPLCRPNSGLCPADYFGRTLVQALPADVKVGVVNVSVGGCKIDLFEQTTFADYVATAPGWMKGALTAYGGNPYQRLVDMARIAQQSGVIKGILLHQGESNTGDATWPAKVKSVYERILADLGLKAADVPLLVGELVAADQQGKCASMNPVIAELPATIPTAHVVSSAGCEAGPDHLHFTPAGYRELGKRYAETMLPLLGSPAPAAK
ncbi:MAG TPA: sialate O-acetylesterase [Lacunisphaera sp.]